MLIINFCKLSLIIHSLIYKKHKISSQLLLTLSFLFIEFNKKVTVYF